MLINSGQHDNVRKPRGPVSVLYDRDDPANLIVMQSPKYVFVHNPNAAFGGPTMIAVPTARAAGHDTQ